MSNEPSSATPIPQQSSTPSQDVVLPKTPAPAPTAIAPPAPNAGTNPTVLQGIAQDAAASTQSSATIPSATATPVTSEPRFKGATKQKVHNASIVLTELYSQLETLTQLENRAPSTRGSVLVHILQARDGLLQMQDLLKDD